MSFDTFVNILQCPVYTNPYLGRGYTLKSVIADPKVLPLNSYKRENKLDLFYRIVPKGFRRTQDFLSVTEMVNHMFIFFAFSLYNMPLFTPPYILFYQRYASDIYRQNMFLVL